MRKALIISAGVVLLGVATGAAYTLGVHSQQDNLKTTSSIKNTSSSKASSKASNEVAATASSQSSYSTTSSFAAGGEMADSASQKDAIMTAKSGAKITAADVQEARQQLRAQGVSDGDFSDLDIAKVIDKANESSLDYKSAIKVLYPKYFE
jgi:hypothetical protein